MPRPVPRGSRQSRPADAQGISAVRLAGQQLQVHRGIYRPTPDQQHARQFRPRRHRHHPARVFHAQGREGTGPDLDDLPIESAETLFKKPVPVEYNPNFPIEEFDFIITDECHHSIYNLWRQVLEYFDASLIGLTATPSKQTFGFFQQNLVMEYNHEKAVADGVNVGCDIYRISTAITQGGSKVDAGFFVDKRDRADAQSPVGAARRSPRLRCDAARPRRGGTGSNPHRVGHVPRQGVHRNVSGPHRSAQDPHLRQG